MNFEINWTKIKGSCQPGKKVVIHNSKSDLPLLLLSYMTNYLLCTVLGVSYITNAARILGESRDTSSYFIFLSDLFHTTIAKLFLFQLL